MARLNKKEKELSRRQREANRGTLERKRKRKFEFLKNTNQMGLYISQKIGNVKVEVKPKIVDKITFIKPKKLTSWQRIKKFFIRLRRFLSR